MVDGKRSASQIKSRATLLAGVFVSTFGRSSTHKPSISHIEITRRITHALRFTVGKIASAATEPYIVFNFVGQAHHDLGTVWTRNGNPGSLGSGWRAIVGAALVIAIASFRTELRCIGMRIKNNATLWAGFGSASQASPFPSFVWERFPALDTNPYCARYFLSGLFSNRLVTAGLRAAIMAHLPSNKLLSTNGTRRVFAG